MRHSGIAPQENDCRHNQHNQADADAEDAARQVAQGDGDNSPDMRVLTIYVFKGVAPLPFLQLVSNGVNFEWLAKKEN